jgi:ABC-type transport system substrate-binding protein
VAAMPDAGNIFNVLFRGNRDYTSDALVQKTIKQAALEFDSEKRDAIFTPALDRINEMAYVLPVSELPVVFAHTKDVSIKRNLLSAGEIRIEDYFWN